MHTAIASPATLMVREVATHDVDAHTSELGDWMLRYDQLDCGTFEGRFTDVRWPGVQLFSEKTTRRVHQRGQLPANSVAVACLLSGEGDVFVDGRRETPNVTMAVHDAEVDTCTPAGCTLAGVVVDTALLTGAAVPWSRMKRVVAERRMLSLHLPAKEASSLRQLLCAAITAVREGVHGVAAQHQLRDDLLLKVVETLAYANVTEAPIPSAMRRRVVDRARDVLLADCIEPPSLLALSRHVGVSPRKLAYCFEDVLGMSPARYLKLLRLNAARRELRTADVGKKKRSVYDVAARWGFWHFGHFSADYKQMFAESPSETLRAGRA